MSEIDALQVYKLRAQAAERSEAAAWARYDEIQKTLRAAEDQSARLEEQLDALDHLQQERIEKIRVLDGLLRELIEHHIASDDPACLALNARVEAVLNRPDERPKPSGDTARQ